MNVPDPLRAPEQKRKFGGTDRDPFIRTDTAAVLDRGPEIHRRDDKILGFYEIDNREIGGRREFERGLGNTFLLVGTAKVTVFCLLHELLPCSTGLRDRIGHMTGITDPCEIVLPAGERDNG